MIIDRLDIRPDIPTKKFLMCLRDTKNNEGIIYEMSEELYDKLFGSLSSIKIDK